MVVTICILRWWFWVVVTTVAFNGNVKAQLCRPWCSNYSANYLHQSKHNNKNSSLKMEEPSQYVHTQKAWLLHQWMVCIAVLAKGRQWSHDSVAVMGLQLILLLASICLPSSVYSSFQLAHKLWPEISEPTKDLIWNYVIWYVRKATPSHRGLVCQGTDWMGRTWQNNTYIQMTQPSATISDSWESDWKELALLNV